MSEILPCTVFKLSPADLASLSDGIAAAFMPQELALFIAKQLDRNMDHYLSGPTHRMHVYFLIRSAEEEEWLVALLAAISWHTSGSDLSTKIRELFQIESSPNFEALLVEDHHILEAGTPEQIYPWVCRIHAAGNIDGQWMEIHGSGILIAPDLVLTNYHVLRDINRCGGPDAASVIFDHVPGGHIIPVGLMGNWQPPFRSYNPMDAMPGQSRPDDTELDYAILRLNVRVGEQTRNGAAGPLRGWLRLRDPAIALTPVPGPNSAILIYQYPQDFGQPPGSLKLSYGVSMNSPWPELRFRYTAPSKGGSSGSPCFNHNCEFVALHHAADSTKPPRFNQGIPVAAIVKDLAKQEQEDGKFTQQGSDLPWNFLPPSNEDNGGPENDSGLGGGGNGDPPPTIETPPPVGYEIDMTVLGKSPSIIFVNRANFRTILKDLLPEDTGYRVVGVQGEQGSGKSHSRYLVEHAGRSNGIRVAYFDAAVMQDMEDACIQLADLMAFSTTTMKDMEQRVLSDDPDPARIGKKFASWLTRTTSELASDRWWLMIDGLAPSNNPNPVIRDHLVGAMLEKARLDQRFTRVKLFLLGGEPPGDAYLASLSLRDLLEPLNAADIAEFLKKQAEQKGKTLRDDEVAMLMQKLLGSGGDVLTAQQMRSLRTGMPEILKVLS